jgi:hypothetical protein
MTDDGRFHDLPTANDAYSGDSDPMPLWEVALCWLCILSPFIATAIFLLIAFD